MYSTRKANQLLQCRHMKVHSHIIRLAKYLYKKCFFPLNSKKSFFINVVFCFCYKNCSFGDLYDQRISSPYGEVDTCGIVVFHSTNNYQHLVYLNNLTENDEVVCLCFPKNSEVTRPCQKFELDINANKVAFCIVLRFQRHFEML